MYLYGIILLLVCCIIGILIKQKVDQKNVEKIHHKRQEIQKLNVQIADAEKIFDRYSELAADKETELNNIKTQVLESTETLEKLAHDGREVMAKQLEQEEIARRNLLDEKMSREEEKLYQEYLEKKALFESLIEPIKKELDDYQAKKEATIEAIKREQELRDNLAFHQIKLSKADREDIDYLEDILGKLNNRTAIAKVIYDVYIATPTKELLNRIVGADKKSGVYRITNINSQECYVGQSTDLRARLTQHIRGSLGIQTIADQRVHHAMAETGLQNWTFEVLEFCDKIDLNDREKYWINYYKSNEFGYNRTVGNK